MATRFLSPFVRVGQVIQKSVRDEKNLVKVRIQKMKLDKRLLMYFPYKKDYWSIDYNAECKVGDIVVIRNLEKTEGRALNTYVDSFLYQVGNTVDPVTQRPCLGTEYLDPETRKTEQSKRSETDISTAT